MSPERTLMKTRHLIKDGQALELNAFYNKTENMFFAEAYKEGQEAVFKLKNGNLAIVSETADNLVALNFERKFNYPAVDYLLDSLAAQIEEITE